MIYTYLKIALRNVLRNKTFSVINLLGLTIGLTTFLGISLYVVDELSYDRFHEKKDRIYRAIITANFDGQVNKWGGVPNLVAPTAIKEIPEVEKATRVFHHNFGDIGFISTGEEKFSETKLFFADPEILDVFTIPLVKGNPKKALEKSGTVILSESTAKKYFGDKDPIGKTLTVDNKTALEVTGIYKDFPSNSFLQCNLIASFSSCWAGQDRNQSWGNASFDTYFLLQKGSTQEVVNQKIEQMLAKNIEADGRWFTIALKPLLDVRLYSGDLNATFDKGAYGDIEQVKILMGLALIVLIIASINYMNLTTAQAQRRNKEVGISKTLGATFMQLNRKFYLEASLFVLLSLMASVVIFLLMLPFFNHLSGKNISNDFITSGNFWLGFLLVWFVLTLLSGSYPAFYLSSFSPKSVLQKTSASGSQAFIRKGLVVFQFSVSIILIICSVIFYKQMNFIRDKKLGYKPEQVMAVMTTGASSKEEIMSLKNELQSQSDILSVCRSQSFPGIGTSMRSITKEGSNEEQGASILTARATHEVLSVLDIKLLAGNNLPEIKDAKDTTTQVVINKATTDYLGLSPEEAIGKRVNIQGFDGLSEVVGVMEDFHFTSLHQKISPYCFNNNTRSEGYNYLLIKLRTENLPASVEKIEATFKKVIPSAFEYSFLDQKMSVLYAAEERLSTIVLIFASLAIFIACLGLYALATFTTEQRKKEIGVRKVLGASVSSIIMLLSKDFLLLVIIAFVIGIPAGYMIMNNWLEGFAYKTTINTVVFIAAGILAIAIAWITISFETFKAASSNPTKSLRSE